MSLSLSALCLSLSLSLSFSLSPSLPPSHPPSRQKVNLWQHADELEQEQVAKGIWLDSRDITDCMGCKTLFTIFNRKVYLINSIYYLSSIFSSSITVDLVGRYIVQHVVVIKLSYHQTSKFTNMNDTCVMLAGGKLLFNNKASLYPQFVF